VGDGSPAASTGLKVNDQLLSLGQQNITNDDQLRNLTKSLAGQTVEMTYIHNGQTLKKQVTLNKQNNSKGFLGVSTFTTTLYRSTWSAPIVGIVTALQFSWLTIKLVALALFSLVIGHGSQAAANVAGPVGVFEILKIFSHFGLNFILFIIADVSIALAVMNLLPIPALDGGRLFVILLYRLRRKILTPETEERIQATGMVVLLLLMVLITVIDVRRF
jgi:regulator of sigma E protease